MIKPLRKVQPVVQSPLATKGEAAAYLRMSTRSFERHVLPKITRIHAGGRFLYEWEELDRWRDMQRVGSSDGEAQTGRITSVSRTKTSVTIGPLGREILKKLEKKRLASTPRLFPVANNRPH